MSYSVESTGLPGVLVLTPRVFEDARGFFFESHSDASFEVAVGRPTRFIQDNHSLSITGVLRGLHYQLPPAAQGKLVRCTAGRIWDVAVDVRAGSPTLGRWFGVELTSDNRKQLWVPEGFAHGFVVLGDVGEVQYKTTSGYDPSCEASVRWSDPDVGIDWPIDEPPILSDKDAHAPLFCAAKLMPEVR
jgi:dTDP-4-dehydrorhamnose 3,5-epimerase